MSNVDWWIFFQYSWIIWIQHKMSYFSDTIHHPLLLPSREWTRRRLPFSCLLCFLIWKLIKIKSEHKMVFKKFKWNNLHWECVKMLMHSPTKPHNRCRPFWALIVFHMDAFIHYSKIINIKNISVLIFLLFVKAQSTVLS